MFSCGHDSMSVKIAATTEKDMASMEVRSRIIVAITLL